MKTASEENNTELDRILSYVNNISLELATMPQDQDIALLITRKLKEATGAIGATFGEYDPETREIIIKKIDTDSRLINAAAKVLGFSLLDIRSQVTDEIYHEIMTNQIGFKNSLTEVSFGEIPAQASKIFMATLNISYFAGLAYVIEGKLYGTSLLAFRDNVPKPSEQMLRALCNIIAVSFRRHKTEVHLQQSLKALQESEERFRNIAEHITDTIFQIDNEGTILYLSPSAKQLFGYEPEEMLGKNIIRFTHKLDINKALSSLRKAISNSLEAMPLTLRLLRKNGDDFYGEFVTGNVHEDGKISGNLGIIRDVTNRIKAEEEIRDLNAELEVRVQERTAELVAANHEMEAFSYSVSHDLRSPLRTISGFSTILIEDCRDRLTEEGLSNLKRIVDATHYMGQLIDDMLNLARINKAGVHPVTIDLSKLVHGEIETLLKVNSHRIVSLDIKPGILVKGDYNLIHDVIQNLVNNALKFTSTREKTHITFGTVNKDGRQVCFIKDNGVGFDMKYYDKLFQPFQRLHNRTEFSGTGIGLASVRRIITKHYGDIWANSKLGKGTTFYFYLGV